MPILIDGHNLIARLPTLSLRDPDDEEQLVRLLASYRARTGKRIAVVFDPGAGSGLRERRRYAGVEVLFAPSHSSADREISVRVARSREPGEWLVVTSDRNLAETVTRQGARVRDAGEFAAELRRQAEQTTPQRESPLSPDEVEAWLSLFEDRD